VLKGSLDAIFLLDADRVGGDLEDTGIESLPAEDAVKHAVNHSEKDKDSESSPEGEEAFGDEDADSKCASS
jgi:hypothetical protein